MNKLLSHPFIDCILCGVFGLVVGGCVAKNHYQSPDGPVSPRAELTLTVSPSPKIGHFIDITGETSSNQVRFRVTGPVKPDIREAGDKGLTLVTAIPGSYTIQGHAYLPHWYWPWRGSIVEANKVILVSSDSPIPPGPNPPPTPPPGPEPPPTPTDPFMAALQAAWSQETDKGKVDQIHKLAAAFQTAGTKTVNDPALTNMGQLWTTVHDDLEEAVGAGNLPKTRSAIGIEMKKSLPSSTSTALDDTTRRKAQDFFNRMAEDVGALK